MEERAEEQRGIQNRLNEMKRTSRDTKREREAVIGQLFMINEGYWSLGVLIHAESPPSDTHSQVDVLSVGFFFHIHMDGFTLYY